jgi:hypothetical protein
MRRCNREDCQEEPTIEQLEEVIEEIRRLMLSQHKKLSARRKLIEETCKSSREATTTTTTKSEEQEDNSKGEFGIQGDFNNRAEELMRRSS